MTASWSRKETHNGPSGSTRSGRRKRESETAVDFKFSGGEHEFVNLLMNCSTVHF